MHASRVAFTRGTRSRSLNVGAILPARPPWHPRVRSSSNASALEEPSILCSTKAISPGNYVATLTISNPRKLNVVNTTLLRSLTTTCQSLSTNPSIRAVVLTGAQPAQGKQPSFIGGADITEMHALQSPEQAKTFITGIHEACAALRNLPVPIIARIHGFALGAGLEIAASCDLRIATSTSVFAMPEVAIGIPSVVEAAYLPSLIGMGRTRRLVYLAERIRAEKAEQWGLVEKVVPGEIELDAAVDQWVDRLAEMGSGAIAIQKRLMQKWENCGVDEGVEAGIEAFGEAFEEENRGEIEERMGKFVRRKR
jgi:enoyl-CoA hydratase/carnithine racemase